MNRLHHGFSVEHAELYGIECAILIHHIQFWIEQNQRMKRNFYDGKTWMYQTQDEIAACYSYWNREKVQRILQKLQDLNVLVKGNYNKNSFDKTGWYAFENEKMFTKVQNCTIDCLEPNNPLCENEQTIPYTKPYTKQIQQQAAPVSAVVSLESKVKKREIYSILDKLDIPKNLKIRATKKFDEQTVKDAIEWSTDPKNPPIVSLEASFIHACNHKLSRKHLHDKKSTPYETVREYFENGIKYNGAECFLSEKSIAFQRGMKHEEILLDKFFNWKKLEDLCNSFKIRLYKEEKK